jgi:hypothetical protein
VNATTEGVVLDPSAFSITLGVCKTFDQKVTQKRKDPPKPFQIHKQNPIDGLKKRFLPISNRYYLTVYCCRFSLTLPSIVATQEFVVPKSMPITSLPAAAFPLQPT